MAKFRQGVWGNRPVWLFVTILTVVGVSNLLLGIPSQPDSKELVLEDFTGQVVGIMDGDTIEVMHGGHAERIRLQGIDCPEGGQPFGKAAKQATSDLAFGKEVMVNMLDVDRYGRTVAEVTLPDGRSLNVELVRTGLAWWYRKYAPSDARLEKLEAEARNGLRGLWADASAIPPWEWRAARARSTQAPRLGNR